MTLSLSEARFRTLFSIHFFKCKKLLSIKICVYDVDSVLSFVRTGFSRGKKVAIVLPRLQRQRKFASVAVIVLLFVSVVP